MKIIRPAMLFGPLVASRAARKLLDCSRGLCWSRLLFPLPFLLPMSACSDGDKPVEEEISLTVYGYNHSDRSYDFSVRDGVTGAGGAARAHGQSGGSCCYSVPAEWRPGLLARIEWTPDGVHWNSTDVPIPQYDGEDVSSFSVHFMREGGMKVFATRYALGHPNYPLHGAEAELIPGVAPGAPWWRGEPSEQVREESAAF